ncbi:CYTH and CHAD domain-containing protein [Cellulomonas fimi]|uniref:CYTH and CHAD domain-containing protein n=1 Tax=Cellulomonas fimi TaxID=1708 RepID=A0A7Y0LWY2_CELFI|nr:CYTH and CHAD domain-containing protein [Cellulomonas fimi]NMR19339.1 CYTH and CHAD domain-containing protein [Cellulomonas fimi]
MATHREIETKLEAPAAAVLPDLTGLPGVASVDEPEEIELEAVYLDTPDLRLTRAGLSLRRRTGGPDAGWHVKLPAAGDERTELQAPLGDDDGAPPPALAAAIRARVRGAALEPVAVLRTRRTVHRLRDAEGQVLAEVADDRVTSRAPGERDVVVDAWREWEVELVDGDRPLLRAALARLEAADGTTAAWSSKLRRALRDRLAADGPDDAARPASGSAGAVLQGRLRAHRDRLLELDPAVRRDEPDAVHQMRVTTRRLRSALTTFRPLLDRERSELVRAEVRWLTGVLGAARDAEVERGRLSGLVHEQPAELVLGPVAARLDQDRAQAYRAAHDEALAAMDSDRYLRLLDALDALVDDPPFSTMAELPAATLLPRLVRHEFRRLGKRLDAAQAAEPGRVRDAALHESRKAAKRARYAAELVAPVVGRAAERSAEAAEAVQDLLGEHHDTVGVRDHLRRIGIEAHLAGENAFTYGRLHALEEARAQRLEQRVAEVADPLRSKKRRRWMR